MSGIAKMAPYTQSPLYVFVHGSAKESRVAEALWLHEWWNTDGEDCDLDLYQLKAIAGISIRSLKRILPGMEKKKWIKRSRLKNGSTVYRLTIPVMKFSDARATLASRGYKSAYQNGKEEPSKVPKWHLPRGQNGPSSYYCKRHNSNKTRSNTKYSESFDIFWGGYPKKNDKQGAYQEWLKLGAEDDPDLRIEIISGMERQKKPGGALDPGEEDGKYIIYACRWLKRRRWEDEGVKTPPAEKKASDCKHELDKNKIERQFVAHTRGKCKKCGATVMFKKSEL